MTKVYTWIVEIRHNSGEIEKIEVQATTSAQAEKIASGRNVKVVSVRLKE